MTLFRSILDWIKGARKNAAGAERENDVQQSPVGGGFHRFAPCGEQVVADFGRVRMLAQAVSDELLRIVQHGERPSVFEVNAAFISCAKRCGLYIDKSDWRKFGDLKRKRSGESEVYADADNKILTKFKDPAAKQPIKKTQHSDWLYEHIIHNILFPEARYEFVGIAEVAGDVRIVLQQQNIESVDCPDDRQIESAMKRLGLLPERRYFYGNEVLAVTDVSSKSDNVLLAEDGSTVFIDPLIELKRPAVEVIDFLTGVNFALSEKTGPTCFPTRGN